MNVLIIDDDRGTAGALAQALRTGGFTDTRVGCSPDEARDCIRQGVRPDVVFLDVDHPHIDAFALAKELCAALPRRPLLVAVTGRSETASRSRQEGFDVSLLKPVDAQQLIDVVGAHAARTRGPES